MSYTNPDKPVGDTILFQPLVETERPSFWARLLTFKKHLGRSRCPYCLWPHTVKRSHYDCKNCGKRIDVKNGFLVVRN